MSDKPTPETEEPKTFSEFCDKALVFLKGKMAEQRVRRFNSGSPRPGEMRDLHALVSRADTTSDFIQSRFWTKYLVPFLKSEQAEANMKPWRPGDPYEFRALKAEFLFVSGKYWVCEKIFSIMDEWIEEGKRAAQSLDFESRRKSKFDKEENP